MGPKMTQNGPKTRKNAKNDDFLTFFAIFCKKMQKNAKKNMKNARICIGRQKNVKKNVKNTKKHEKSLCKAEHFSGVPKT
jgi:hypothetical protein